MRWSSEADAKSWAKTRLQNEGAVVLPVVASMMQVAGWPDQYVAHIRFQGWIEWKFERGALSALQKHVIKELRAREVPVLVARAFRDGTIEGWNGQGKLIDWVIGAAST